MGLLRASGVTNQGPFRSTNEDCFVLDNVHGLGVVADGMGGHNAGEVAARLAVEAVADYVRARNGSTDWPFGFDPAVSHAANVLRTAVHLANLQILQAAGRAPEYAGMGTTIVAAILQPGRVAIAHVGDSRLYLFREGRLQLLTRDDSWGTRRHVLTNVLGTRPHIEVHVADQPLEPGELVVLMTDGVHGTLDDVRMTGLVSIGRDPDEIASKLVNTALRQGSRDNCTALVLALTPQGSAVPRKSCAG